METLNAIKKRSSVRKFTDKPVSDEDLKKILLSGSAAPVGIGRYETLRITVVRDAAVLERIGAGVSRDMSAAFGKEMKRPFNFYGAGTLVIVSSKDTAIKGINYTNGGTVAENMMLQAAEGGIGSCFVWFAGTAIDKDAELKSALSIPEDFHPMFSLVFGYAKEDVPEKTLTEMKIECNYV